MAQSAIERYSGLAQTLHWLTVVLFVIVVIVALIMTGMDDSATKDRLYALHKSLGVTILALTILRLIWRRLTPAPPLPDDVRRWERVTARTVQALLYVALIEQPLCGLFMVWSDGLAVTVFGVLPIPNLVDKSESLNAIFDPAHAIIGWAFICLAALHAAGALRHQFVGKDDILSRMLPGKRP